MPHEPEHPLWTAYVAWSAENVSPGDGHGHRVEWYWIIWKTAYEATLLDFANHSVCCPARHEADKRLQKRELLEACA